MSVIAGELAPNFTLLDQDGSDVCLSDQRGYPVILFFYPKDDTPGCTQQACDFRDRIQKLEDLGVSLYGVSRDSAQSHLRFRDKHDLPYPLLVDQDGSVCQAYDVWKERSMYGRRYMGIERSTFLIDQAGFIREVWRKVKVPGHVDQVIEAVST